MTTTELATEPPVYVPNDTDVSDWVKGMVMLLVFVGFEESGLVHMFAPNPTWMLWCENGCGCAGEGPCWYCETGDVA